MSGIALGARAIAVKTKQNKIQFRVCVYETTMQQLRQW